MELNVKPLNKNFLPYGRHVIDEDDIACVVKALKSTNLTQGAAVDQFEEQLCRATGAKYAVAVTNGTAALHLAGMALGLKPGAMGVTSSITFAASSNFMLYNGLSVGFTDVERETGLMSMQDLEAKLEDAKKSGKPIELVVPVHFAGQSCDMNALWALKKKFGFKIIEDASHAIGARYQSGKLVGSSDDSEMTTISFHAVKHITTGEGGVILTNNPDLYAKLRRLRSHGIVKDPAAYIDKAAAFDPITKEAFPWYYEMQELGYNYRLPDINAALGFSQLQKLDYFVKVRRQHAALYDELFKDNQFLTPLLSTKYGESSYHLYTILLKPAVRPLRGKLLLSLLKSGIGTQVHYIPVPSLPYYSQSGHRTPANAQEFYNSCLSIPMYPALTTDEVRRVVTVLNVTIRDLLGNL
jgi:UDP-4-amino-4,6-dideoxy-N-acetyl-beta-L-altrosamine transaminase